MKKLFLTLLTICTLGLTNQQLEAINYQNPNYPIQLFLFLRDLQLIQENIVQFEKNQHFLNHEQKNLLHKLKVKLNQIKPIAQKMQTPAQVSTKEYNKLLELTQELNAINKQLKNSLMQPMNPTYNL